MIVRRQYVELMARSHPELRQNLEQSGDYIHLDTVPRPRTHRQPFRPGDIIARCFSRLGIRKCGGCARRHQKINRAWAWITSKLKG